MEECLVSLGPAGERNWGCHLGYLGKTDRKDEDLAWRKIRTLKSTSVLHMSVFNMCTIIGCRRDAGVVALVLLIMN
ncbi:hypothetical protein E2C01_097793 [Portunus trituberculatus]|uniref:Uncharacterized protein n=1 Tax=Portunus trituberculatus TaxID=210409 RepID=A0A5B7KCB0_PORTR|nr:hypothetical protein [Portunus trituberculatus]